MNGKQGIIIFIIVAALAAAGVFAYMSFSADSSVPADTTQSATNQILPNGTKLDFGTINKFNETGREFSYPRVTPSDAGQTLNEIVKK